MKFGFHLASGFREEDACTLWKTEGRKTIDGWTPDHKYPKSSPMSLRLRCAKNVGANVMRPFFTL